MLVNNVNGCCLLAMLKAPVNDIDYHYSVSETSLKLRSNQ
jgi:hypothetical protein